MKTNAIIRICIYSLLILILLGIFGSVLGFGMYMMDGRLYFEDHSIDPLAPTEALQEIDIEYISPDVRNIEIDWVAGNIYITRDDVISDIVITETGPANSEYKMVCKQSGQTLKIEFCEDHEGLHLFGNNHSFSKDLSIRVPANWTCKDLEIDAAAADVTVTGMEISEMDFDGASGMLTLDGCDIGKLNVDTASGDVEFSGKLDILDFNAASARFDGEFFNIPRDLKLDAMSGDLTIVIPEHSGVNLKLDTMSGSFDSDFDFRTTGSGYQCGDGACQIRVSAMSSDVHILKGISKPAENCNH